MNNNNYTALYEMAASLVPQGSRVVELGCGTGNFAKMIIPKCVQYTGYDISETAIASSRIKNVDNYDDFVLKDIADKSVYEDAATFVALEVLEHLHKDCKILLNIRKGCRIIFSVPSFDSTDHKRYFPYEHSALNRYEQHIDIDFWRKVKIPTGGGYFHLLRGYR